MARDGTLRGKVGPIVHDEPRRVKHSTLGPSLSALKSSLGRIAGHPLEVLNWFC
jgi:hypothetical protein